MTSRALASKGRVARVGLMAHPTPANTTVIEPVTGGCSPEGFMVSDGGTSI